jgi:putative hydroxymethylpyrimidine transport system permease protein
MNWHRPVITLFGLLAIWQCIIWIGDIPKFILPTPLAVIDSLISKYQIIAPHFLTTFTEIIVGLLIGIILGMGTALCVSAYLPARRWMMPLLIASQAIPVFAIAPILVLWFGFGMGPKIAMSSLIIYFPVTVNFLDGLNRTDPAWQDMARIMQSGSGRGLLARYRFYRFIKIPAALPALASGIRIATAVAPIGAVVGEWVGSSSGLGYLMLHANARVQTDLLFASLLLLTLLAVCLYFLIDHGLKRLLPWQSDVTFNHIN